MERVQRTSGGARSASGTVVDARASLALWLRAGRAQKNMSLDDVAKVTKIQSRILERLEAGKFDGLPAEVFVRGFVRSFARCVGLDEDEALKRYTACTKAEPPPSAKALIDSMSELAPASASSVTGFRATPIVVEMAPSASAPVEIAPIASEPVEVRMLPEMGTLEEVPASSANELAIEAIAAEASSEIPVTPIEAIATALVDKPSKKKKRGAAKKAQAQQAPRGKRKQMATGTPSSPTPVVGVETVAAPAAIDPAAPVIEMLPITTTTIETATPESIAAAAAPSGPVEAIASEPSTAARATTNSDAPATTRAATNSETPPVATKTDAPIAAAAEAFAAAIDAATSATAIEAAAPPAVEPIVEPAPETTTTTTSTDDALAVGGVWSPKMPVVAQVTAPWRLSRGVRATTLAPVVVPSLVIDDADPEVADSQREERIAEKDSRPRARSFLPPILLDRDAGSGRQGGLTLAVIILLIAATLTLSYLMRRPSASGDGYTRNDVSSATYIG